MAFVTSAIAISTAGIGFSAVTAAGVGIGVGVGWGTLLTAASVAYQVTQAKKQRSAARAAAEARKGHELVLQGAPTALPIVYGRALVGGVRVWHKTSPSFNYAGSNAQRQFSIGEAATAGTTRVETYLEDVQNGDYTIQVPGTRTVTVDGYPSTKLDKPMAGSKNDFLIFQQALCQGPIASVQDILINGTSTLDDPTYGHARRDTGRELHAAMRIDCFYDGTACQVATANEASRSTAKFPKAAYATVSICLDQGEAQFQGVPDMQFLIEGRLVGTFSGNNYSLAYDSASQTWTGTRQYSTNPALCLLDYLIDNTCGKAIKFEQLDLPSFAKAAQICARTVMQGAAVGGQIWQPVGKSEDAGQNNVTTRDIPLFECNAIIDVTRPIRQNVETLLSTMGDARLVWSQGKYKLLLQAPVSNAAIEVAGTLTDDDLILDDQIDIKWPSSSERLNYATVRFHNEATNFKEDSASWPPKKSGSYFRPVGARTYALTSGWSDSEGGKLLNEFGVWSGVLGTTTLTYKFLVKTTGLHTVRATVDDSGTLQIQGAPTLSMSNWRNVYTTTFSATKDQVLTVTFSATDTGGLKGAAAVIEDSAQIRPWSTRSPAYTDFLQINQSAGVYDTMIAEDNGVSLESETFADGITDYYHALAKAEEMVRTSRSAFVISFKYQIKDRYFEPGDILRLESSTLDFEEGIYIKVSEAEISDGVTARITGTRFDYTQLAWNVDDDQYLKPSSPYAGGLARPAWLEYIPLAKNLANSSGTLKWAEVLDSRVSYYLLYAAASGANQQNGQPALLELGRAQRPPFELPPLAFGAGIFAVRAVTGDGIMSDLTYSNSGVIERGVPPPIPTLISAVSSTTKAEITLSFDWPLTTTAVPADGETPAIEVPYSNHAVVTVWRNSVNDSTTAVNIGESSTKTFVDTAEVYRPVYYWLKCVTLQGLSSAFSNSLTAEFNHFSGINPDAEASPAPYDLTVVTGFSFFKLKWTNPTHSIGGGHGFAIVYGQELADINETPVFANAVELATPNGSEFWFTEGTSKAWAFWVKAVTKAGGISVGAAGPVKAKTGMIGNVDLGPLIVEADNIADGGITNQKLVPGLEAVVFYTGTSLPTSKYQNATLLSWDGKLYRWDGTAYVAAIAAADLSGLITGSQIADAAINTAKFASGIKPVEIVATLPTTGNTIGRIALLTTDQKIYRWTGTAWTSVVPAGDIAGTITTTQISDGAISTPKLLAGAVTANTIAAGAITAGKISADAVTAGTIAAGAVSANEIAAGAILTDKLAAGSITGDKIAANTISGTNIIGSAITGDHIQANSISAGKLMANTITAAQIASGAIVADKIAAGAIAVGSAAIANGAIRNALIANAAIDSANIKDLAVNTLKIAGNAVTVPITARYANIVPGSGSSTRVAEATITLDTPGYVYAVFTANQTYGSGIKTSQTVLQMGSQSITVGGAAVTTNICVSDAAYLSAGTHTVSVDWSGQDSGVNLQQRVLFVMGVKR